MPQDGLASIGRTGSLRSTTTPQLRADDTESPLLELHSPFEEQRTLESDNSDPATQMGFKNWLSKRDIDANRRKAYRSYAEDWALTLVIASIFFALENIHGYWRYFSLTDTTIQFPFTEHERVPNWALYLIALVAPFILLPVINVLTVRSFWDWHHASLGLFLSLSTTGALTQLVKVTVGRPRPDFIARCQPRPGSADEVLYGLASAAICTQTDSHILRDGFRSFFSGHSSLSFAGLGFLSWYLAGKVHLFDRRGHQFKAWLALTPLAGAMLVAISRTMDNRHHWHDVTVGSIVGLVFSFFAYRQYYPPLSADDAHIPFEPRFVGGLRPAPQSPFSSGRSAEEGGNGRVRREYFATSTEDEDRERLRP